MPTFPLLRWNNNSLKLKMRIASYLYLNACNNDSLLFHTIRSSVSTLRAFHRGDAHATVCCQPNKYTDFTFACWPNVMNAMRLHLARTACWEVSPSSLTPVWSWCWSVTSQHVVLNVVAFSPKILHCLQRLIPSRFCFARSLDLWWLKLCVSCLLQCTSILLLLRLAPWGHCFQLVTVYGHCVLVSICSW